MDKVSDDKVSTSGAIFFSALLGGPLGAFYLISCNFKVFKRFDKIRISLLFGIILTLFFDVIAFLLPEFSKSDFPNFLGILSSCMPAMYADYFQATDIKIALKQGIKKISYLRIIVVSILSLLITFLFSIGIFLSFFESKLK